MSTLVFDNESVTFDGEKSIAEVLIANGIKPSLVMVRVNGEVVIREQYESFIVPEGSEIKVYPFAGPGDDGLDFVRGKVLRFVNDDELARNGAAANIG